MGSNSCYTYFKITGDFEPETITQMLGLTPSKLWSIGDLHRNGTVFDFALWEYGRCEDYDVNVENQMMKTIKNLICKTDILKEIKRKFDVCFTLEIVPSIYVGETNPCLSPSRQVIEFCYHTETDIDIDYYLFNANEKVE